MSSLTFSIIAISISILTFLWTLYYNLSQRKNSNIRYFLQLYASYHSPEMIEARRIAWHELEERMQNDVDLSWDVLWQNNDDSEQRLYNHIQLVLQFWFQLYSLDKIGLLDRRISYELFSYQYSMWYNHLFQFAVNTQENNNLQPDILNSILENQLEWLIKKEI